MESSTVHRVYRFRLEPTPDQEEKLRQFAGARRFIWNWALQQRREYHGQTGKSLPAKELSARLTALKDQLATSFYDAALGQFRRQLQYKGQWYGVHVVVVDRFFPCTQLCHVCGAKKTDLTLADRTWTCPVCGTTHDRDRNAAINIKNEGLRLLAVGHTESVNACGGTGRPPTGARPGEARIPRL